MADDTLDTSSEQPTGGLGAVEVKASPIKGRFSSITPTGNTILDGGSSSSILENMQKMIDEKEAQKGSFLENLKDAAAWTTGGVNGPTQGLMLRGQQKETEAADIYNMRQQMAQFKAQQAQSANMARSLKNALGGSGAAGVSGLDPIAAAEVQRLLDDGRVGEANKLYDYYVKEGIKFGTNPATYKRDIPIVVMGADGKETIENVDAMTARKMVMGGGAKYANPQQGGNVQPGDQPTGGNVQPGAQPTGGASLINAGNVTWSSLSPEQKDKLLQAQWKIEGFGAKPDNIPTSHNNPGDLVFGDFAKKYGATEGRTVKGPDGVTRTFAQFKTPEEGKAAAKALWDNVYANKPIDEALTKWRGESSSADPYKKSLYDAAGIKYTSGASQPGTKPSTAGGATQPVTETQPETQPVVTGGSSTVPQLQQKMEIEKKAITAELEKTGQNLALRRDGFVEAGENASDRLSSIKYVNGLLSSNPRAFGVLQHTGVLNAIGTAIQGGIQVGKEGVYSSKNVDEAVRKAMKGATEEDIIVAQKAANQLALAQLNMAKTLLKGQGAVSDNERLLIAKTTGDITNSPEALKDILKFGEMRANFDNRVGAALNKWDSQPGNEGKSFRQFMLSPEYLKLRAEYSEEVDRFAKVAGSVYSKESKASTPVGPKEGDTSQSKSGRPTVYKNGAWHYND